MQTVVGIFTSQVAAERAAERLCSLGLIQEQINFLIPGASQAQLEQVPTLRGVHGKTSDLSAIAPWIAASSLALP